jgi:four helix bundle protein
MNSEYRIVEYRIQMDKIQNFRDLEVWQKAHQFALNIYVITKKFPVEEKFGLISQIRRAVISVPANIVEGFKRRGVKDSLHFYTIAEASLEEVRYYLIFSQDLKYISSEIYKKLESQAEETAKMLFVFKKAQN